MEAILSPYNSSPSSATKNSAPNGKPTKAMSLSTKPPSATSPKSKARQIGSTLGHDLGISPVDYITETYAALFFSWKRQSQSPAEKDSRR
jgi:hypothetical protein